MHMLRLGLPLVIFLVCVINGENSDWIDPDDMLIFDHSSMKMVKPKEEKQTKPPEENKNLEKVSTTNQDSSSGSDLDSECNCEPTPCPAVTKCPPEKECVCEQASLRLLQNYIKILLNNIDNQTPEGTADYIMHINLSADQILILTRFLVKGDPGHVHDVHEILSAMVKTAMTSEPSSMEKFALLLEHKIGLSLNRLIQFGMLISMASILLFIEIRLQIPWRRRVSQLIVLMFVISVPWTWYELYKQAEIAQQSQTIKKIPTECQENASDYWKTLLSYVSLQKDQCAEYYENIMIDPIVKVPPTKAIAVTFVRFFMAPLKDIGTAFSEFLRALLSDLPITYYPVAVIMVTVFFFLFLFMMFGYSIRLPFFLTIERNQPQAVADGQVHQAIGDGNRQILEQLQDITDRIKANDIQFQEKMDDLKQVQELAIEYNMSSTSQAESPSIPKPIAAIGAHSANGATADNLQYTNDSIHSNLYGNESNDKVDGMRKKRLNDKTVKNVVGIKDIGPYGDNTDDDDDDDDDDDARKGPVIDTLLSESLSHGNVDVLK